MADVVIFHNPNCSTSRHAVEAADAAGVDYEIVKYMLVAERPDRATLEQLVDQLEDPATDLVRRDANFKKLGLTEADVATSAQVVDVLAAHGQLLQRPVLVKDGVAIIGRPKDRVLPFLTG
ncbi:MAG: arsenate reductase [Actinobacteria bacterium]|nr:arsenate reductase [Actinomycetota bacterium]